MSSSPQIIAHGYRRNVLITVAVVILALGFMLVLYMFPTAEAAPPPTASTAAPVSTADEITSATMPTDQMTIIEIAILAPCLKSEPVLTDVENNRKCAALFREAGTWYQKKADTLNAMAAWYEAQARWYGDVVPALPPAPTGQPPPREELPPALPRSAIPD